MLPLSFGLLITGLYSVNNQEVIMNQRISPTPEQTAAAWVEFKQWYANCITAAPKATGSELESFCVIDDRRLEIENFVQVDQRDGFSYDNYLKAQNFLVRDPKPELILL